MPVVLDINNFWSPSGGGVRRYHLEKMAHYGKRTDAQLVFLVGSSKDATEFRDGVVLEHRRAFRFPGTWEYRYFHEVSALVEVLCKWQPDVIEVGSPYLLPQWVRLAVRRSGVQSRVVGFWHADFPVTYVRRWFTAKCGPAVAKVTESMAWWLARREYGWMDMVFASCHEVLERMAAHGLHGLEYLPLGVDTRRFHPERRDESLRVQYQAGDSQRPVLFFPHRFCEEKGLLTLLAAWPGVIRSLGVEPALVFAGTGPDQYRVEEAVQQFSHVHFLGYISDPDVMAKWQASADLGFALSGWETFGLSILEALASGLPLVGADMGAAAEHVRGSGCGALVPPGNVEALETAIVNALREPCGARARQARAYAERFTWDACFSRQVEIYKELSNC